MTTVIASPGQGPDRQVEVQYTCAKVVFVCFPKLNSFCLKIFIAENYFKK